MILSFKTHLGWKPTLFTNKIARCLWRDYENDFIQLIQESKHSKAYTFSLIESPKETKPKLHTIRRDLRNRWEAGKMIDFFIETRTSNMFRFAPRVPCVSTQKIHIIWFDLSEIDIMAELLYPYLIKIGEKCVVVHIDEVQISQSQIENLAINDGFDSVDEFFTWFNEDYEGKIIHWTSLKY